MKFVRGLGDIGGAELRDVIVEEVLVPARGLLGLDANRVVYDGVIKVGEVQIDPQTVKESEPSKTTYHSTIFETFRLKARSTYNFYTKDETTTFDGNVSASLDQLPRYVTLTWGVSPRHSVIMQGDKSVKPFMVSPIPPQPVVPFDIVRAAAANGYIQAGVLNTTIKAPPPPEAGPVLDQDAFLMSPDAGGQLAASHVGKVESPFTLVRSTTVDSMRVNFVDPSIAGALDANRIAVSTDDLHLNTAGSLSKIVGGLEIISEFNQDVAPKNPPPSFPAPADAPIVSYVGYVIERYDVASDGTMKLGRTIGIDNVDTGYFVDREVLYGMTYAYKIRSIVQWVHPATVAFGGQSAFDRLAKVEEVIGTKVASYLYGDWSDWAKTQVVDTEPPDPPDELIVQPYSRKGYIRISWKMPDDPQFDIDSVHLVRAVVNGGHASDWFEVGSFAPGNGAYNDDDVLPFEDSEQEYIYAMYSTSLHGETSTLGEQVLARLVSPKAVREHPLVRTAPIGSDRTVHPVFGDPRESTEIVATRRVVIYCRGGESVHPLRDRDYLLDVRSLSTGERVQVSLNVDSTEILSKDA